MSGTIPSITTLVRGLLPAIGVGAASITMIGVCIGYPCASTGLRYGMWLDRCPATDMRLEVSVDAIGLVRGDEGEIVVRPTALWLEGKGANASRERRGFSRGIGVQLALLDADGAVAGELRAEPFRRDGEALRAKVTLPDIPDGDYRLRVAVAAGFDAAEANLDLPLYVPAVAHVSSDRPLYRPGQEVQLRSVLLARTDLAPLDGRPGRWRIQAPDGTEMHVERGRAGTFGIASTSFPLDDRAEVGTWSATWDSGGSSDRVTFDVRPFRLPRLSVEPKTAARWHGVGDRVLIEGVARYTSGAPVADAPVVVTLRQTSGRWPAPLQWEEPFRARTRPDGTFRIDLGEVPGDLIERATFGAQVQVTEAAGEVVTGGTQVVLSKDDLMVEAVTELGDGLVGGFNNRAYLRVLTPDGRPLPSADVTVTNPWDPAWKPREGRADADGVVALQVDPGKPVTVVDPAVPVRSRPLVPDAPQLSSATEATTKRGLDMAERRALDAVYGDVATCGDLTVGAHTVNLGVRVGRSGAVTEVLHDKASAVDACVAAATRRARFPAGRERTWSMSWRVPDSLRPSFDVNASSAWGDGSPVTEALRQAALQARRCLPRGAGSHGVRVFDVHWRTVAGSAAVSTSLEEHSGSGLSPAALSCVRQALARVSLPANAKADALGVGSLTLSVPTPPGSRPSGPTTRTGYELKVAARADGSTIGETRLVLNEGNIPPLRLRATPSIAHPGEAVTVELFRGPGFSGQLPDKLFLQHGTRKLDEVDVADNKATFTLPSDANGFLHVEHAGARVVILARPSEPLTLAMDTDRAAYRPGETARLTVRTSLGDRPTAAGVGLAGVDLSLGQLATLLGPDDWGRVTVRAAADTPAFGAFDPRALALGQVRGEHAAQAAVLRISHVPMDSAGHDRTSASGYASLDTDTALTDSFYRVLERLIPRVRKWEATAPEGELMRPDRMARFWTEALADLRKEGAPAVDAFGRPVTLDVLPRDLLGQVDPRQVVADGTRLPEDVIDWTRYVAEEVAR